jgi:predicted ribosomally synthesized peptide with SipW-like signal peptide
MKKILLSVATIAVVGALAAGATTAWFSDTETSTGNTFTAGTLDLAVNGQNTGIIPVVVGNIAPGWSKDITYTVKNAGSISGVLSLVSGTVVNTEGLNPESETNTAELGELGANITVTATIDGGAIQDLGVLDNLQSANTVITSLNAGVEKTIVLHLTLPTTVGNDVQGDNVVADFTLSLDQTQGYVDETTSILTLENKYDASGDWQIITTDGINGTLSYNGTGSNLTFNFTGKVNTPSIGYTLLYVGPTGNYPYSGELVLGTATAGTDSSITISGTVTPASSITGGKVWLVPSTTYPTGWSHVNNLYEGTSLLNFVKI